jgi:glyoxylase-like metal-dependent hydrolase (beta-lactamase superfamily II)
VRAKWYGRAHTGGDAVITFERANVAHMGDLMFNRRVPVIDRVNGAIVANWVNVLEKAAADHAADTIDIFGHAGTGHPVTGPRAELMHFRDYLTALLNHTRAAVKAGQTKEQFTATTPTLAGFEAFGAHNARTLGIVYDEVTEK